MNSRTQTGQKYPSAPPPARSPTQMRFGTSHAPDALADGGRRPGTGADGRPGPAHGRRSRQVGRQRAELAAGASPVGRRQALLELVGGQAPVARGAAQRVGHLLALRVGGTDVLVGHAGKASPDPAPVRDARTGTVLAHDAADRRRAGRAPGRGAVRHLARARHRASCAWGARPLLTIPCCASACSTCAATARRRRCRRHVDAVLVSHAHHDHLDLPSLRLLGPVGLVVVPRGAGRALRRVPARSVVEVGGRRRAARGRGARARRARRPRRPPGAAAGSPSEALGFVARARRPPRLLRRRHRALRRPRRRGRAGPLDLALLPVWGWGPSLGPGHMDPEQAARARGAAAPARRHPDPLGHAAAARPAPPPRAPAARAGRRLRPARRPAGAGGRRPARRAGRDGGGSTR